MGEDASDIYWLKYVKFSKTNVPISFIFPWHFKPIFTNEMSWLRYDKVRWKLYIFKFSFFLFIHLFFTVLLVFNTKYPDLMDINLQKENKFFMASSHELFASNGKFYSHIPEI